MKSTRLLQTIVCCIVVVQVYYMQGFDQRWGKKKEEGATIIETESHKHAEATAKGDLADAGEIQLPSPHRGKGLPVVGFGTAGLGGNTKQAVLDALNAGYTHIDSAMAREWYREDLVGEALREAKPDRSTLWITTKLHPKNLGTRASTAAINQSLKDLGSPYLDLLLIHYPHCFGSLCPTAPEGTWQDTWRVMENMQEEGKIRFLGVSNFGVKELKELWEFAREKPSVVQTHSDPLQPNKQIQEFCRNHDIQFEAYSSLGTQHMMRSPGNKNPILTHPDVLKIADDHGVSPGVVILRWALHSGQVVIPRSRNPDHIKQNLEAPNLHLTPREYQLIDALKK